MPSSASPPVDPPKRRLRRIGRRVALAGAVVVVLLLVLLAVVHTPPARRAVLAQVRAALAASQITFDAETLDYNLLTFSAVLDGITVGSASRTDLPPIARIQRVAIDLSPLALVTGRLVVQDGEVVDPDVHVVVDADGDNLPGAEGPPEPEAPPEDAGSALEYFVRRFVISGGRVRYEDREQALDVQVPLGSLTIDGDPVTRVETVALSTGAGHVRLADRTVDLEPLSVDADVRPDQLDIRRVAAGADGLSLSASGRVSDLASPHLALTVDSRLDLRRLAPVAGVAEPVAGVLTTRVEATGPLATLGVRSTIEGRGLAFRGLEGVNLSADATYDRAAETVEVAHLDVAAPQGAIRSRARLALTPDAGTSAVHVALDALDAAGITTALDMPYHAATRVTGTVDAGWPGLAYESASGSADLTLTPTAARPARGRVPVSGLVRAAGNRDKATVDIEALDALGVRLSGNVALTGGEELGGAISTNVSDVATAVAGAERVLDAPAGSLVGTPVGGAIAIQTVLDGTVDALGADVRLSAPALSAGTLTDIAVAARAHYRPEAVTVDTATVAWHEAMAEASGRVGLGPEATIDIRAAVDSLPIGSSLAALDMADVPADGTVSMQAAVTGTPSAPEATLSVQGTNLAAYGERFGVLSVEGTFADREAVLSTLRLEKPQADGTATLAATGRYGLDAGRYSVSVTSTALGLEGLTLPDAQVVTGGIAITADGEGTVDNPGGTAHLALTGLRVDDKELGDITLDMTAADRTARAHLDALRFRVSGDATVALDEPREATVDLLVDGLDMATLPLPPDTPLTGTVHARLEGKGLVDDVSSATADATIDSLQITWNGQPVETEGPATIRFADETLAVDSLRIRALDSVVSVQGTLPLDPETAPGAIDITAAADLASLSQYAPADAGLQMQGTVQLDGRIRGTLARIDPRLTLTASGASVGMASLDQPVTDIGLQFTLQDGIAELSELAASWGTARLSATGRAPLGWLPADLPVELPRPPGAAALHATVTGVDLATLPGAPEDLSGRVALTADVSAPTTDLASMTGTLAFPDLGLGFSGLTLEQQGTSTIGLAGGRVDVQQFSLSGTAGNIDMTGGLSLLDDRQIDMTLAAALDVSALGALADGVTAAGQTSLEVAAAGTLDAPALSGFVDVSDADVALDDPRVAAEGLNARIDFTPERLTLARLDGGLNGGTLTGAGTVQLDGSDIQDVDIQVKASDVALDVPLELRSLSNADITIVDEEGTSDERQFVVGGTVTIQEAGLTEDINLNAGIFQALTAPPSLDLTEQRNPLVERVRFDLAVKTATPVVVDNNLARAELAVDVRLLGTPYETGLSGRLDMAEGSELMLNERRYQVQRGIVTFTDDRSIQPSLDFVLDTSVRDYDVSIQASGATDDMDTTLTSTPSLPEPDIMSLLVTGRTLEEMSGNELDVAKSQMMSVLAGGAAASLGRGLQQATGLSMVRVEPNLIAAEADPGARLTVGQDLTEDVSLVYSTDLVNSSDNIWMTEYDITRRFVTRAVRQSDASYRFDFRHDLRFGGVPEPSRRERPRQTIRSIDVDGTLGLDEERVRQRLDLDPGDRYSFFSVREAVADLQELYADERYLEARIRTERTVEGNDVDVRVRVEAGPRVSLAIEGYDVSNGVVREARRVWSRGVFERQRADDVIEMLRRRLIEDRYLEAEVTADISGDDTSERRVVFRVVPGTRFEKVLLAFEGASGISPDELVDVVHEQDLFTEVFTRPSDVTSLLQRLYRERGYLDATLERPEYSFDETTRQARALFHVEEGPLFAVRSVSFTGNHIYDSSTLANAIPLVVGDPYFPATSELSLVRIRQMYWQLGYNELRPAYALAVDRDNGVVDVTFDMNEGPRSVVAGIDITGLDRTSQQLVRDELALEKGQPLDLSALGRSRKSLYDIGAYSLVDITRAVPEASGEPAPDAAGEGQAGPADQPVDVNVALREVQPFQVRYGVMFDTERGPGGIFDVSNHNSLGRARVIGLQTRYDSQIQEARIYLNQPSLRPLPVETIVSAYGRAERNPATSRAEAFNIDRIGIMVQQERQLFGRYVWSYGYRFERARTYTPDAITPPYMNVSPLTSTLTRETRDDVLDATQGSFFSQALSFSPEFLGSDVPFVKYFGQYFHYFPLQPPTRKRFTNEILRPRLVFATGVRLGLAHGLNGNDVPLSERFLAGGSTTLRGFEQNAVGPRGIDGVPLGGEAMFVINNELRFPLVSIFDGVGFLDIGSVFDRMGDFALGDLRESAGIGLRVRTPWILVRLDYGFPLDRRPGEPRSRFFFSIGQAF